ncbi:hypothetical protein ACIRRA_17655 [Nocardia sp. NPDC101769]|uniref:SbtR family transcriptional regulator n=1 Tax=Nocardia sp. NPDC101769 TaxID=3364333 RepID=UPI00381D6C6E
MFTLLSRMMTNGAENSAVKSALTAAEFDLRTAAPELAADLTGHVAYLLERARTAGIVRDDVTVEEAMALVAGAFAAIHHANAQTNPARSAHLANIILDGLRPVPGMRRTLEQSGSTRGQPELCSHKPSGWSQDQWAHATSTPDRFSTTHSSARRSASSFRNSQ